MKQRKLRVWHVPNVPGACFHVIVTSVEQAMFVLKVLADYDLYLDELIQSNAQGLEVYIDSEWYEYTDDEGNDIGQLMRQRYGG